MLLALCNGVGVIVDSETFWCAVATGDPRFDGWVYCGVKTTGIYCRPSCPARTPKRENVRFFATAASAQAAGFRACKRCRPDAAPGSPEWDRRADLVGRAMRLIADGVVDREGVRGLAGRLGYTERHLHRQLTAVVGAGPLALARAQRAQTARVLLETSDMPIIQVALASGFQSLRQFNDTVRQVFATTPREVRSRAGRGELSDGSDAITLRLPFRAPLDAEGVLRFHGMRSVPGVEATADGAFLRSLRLPNGAGIVELGPANDHIRGRFWLDEKRDLGVAVARCRMMLDLDSDPIAVDQGLGTDGLLGPLVSRAPGRRVAGHVDGNELAFRAVLGQQVSLPAAASLAGTLTEAHGDVLRHARGSVTRIFPSAERLAEADPAKWPMPAARRKALKGLASALASGDLALDAGADHGEARRRLRELPGVGEWTVEYIAMRALRDPGAFPAADLGIRRALEGLGQDGSPPAATRISQRWRPYRAYAVQHLWSSLSAHQVVPRRAKQAAATAVAAVAA